MSENIELGVHAVPDMGGIGPPDRRFTHLQCGFQVRIQPHRITGDHTLLCPGCGPLVTVSDATMHELDIAAILQRSGLVRSDWPGDGTDLIVNVVPLG